LASALAQLIGAARPSDDPDHHATGSARADGFVARLPSLSKLVR
jgi:hypothetical protein